MILLQLIIFINFYILLGYGVFKIYNTVLGEDINYLTLFLLAWPTIIVLSILTLIIYLIMYMITGNKTTRKIEKNKFSKDYLNDYLERYNEKFKDKPHYDYSRNNHNEW